MITDVDFQSEADRKGLRPTMVVTALNDQPVETVVDWNDLLGELSKDTPVKLDVVMPGGDQTYYFFLTAP